MSDTEQPRCVRCGARDIVVRTPESDPLQLSECGRCGSILEIGGHRW